MAISKYFIKKGTDSAKDLYSSYKIYVLKTKGLWDIPTKKTAYEEDWADSNGRKVYESVNNVYNAIEGTIEFAILGDISTVKSNLRSFYSYITSVVPAAANASYGSSSFYIWNDIWGEASKNTIRCIGFDTGAQLQYQNVEDMQNPNKLVSAYTFTLKFSIDKPTLIF